MVDWHGVRIVNAIVTGFLDLQNADVEYVTDLEHCDFTGYVDLAQSTFLKGLFVNRSWFVSVNFDHATIDGQFDASNAVFFDERPHETRFNAMKVLGDSICNHTTFWGARRLPPGQHRGAA